MSTLNLGVVAHVDAGKTTLTERLLFETGVTTTIGRVDHGDTVTDTDALERRRGITIRSAVVAFHLDDLKVNLIDTPGHSDFVAEVERALAVLDAAVLVVSAVEGVQAQTRVLIRILERLHLPFLIFVNKIDRVGASDAATLSGLDEALAGRPLLMTEPTDLGSRRAGVASRDPKALTEDVFEALAEEEEGWLTRFVEGRGELSATEVRRGIALLTRQGRRHPTYFGAALHGIGVPEILAGLRTFLPPPPARRPSADEPLHASVFKIHRGHGGQKVAFARMRSGHLAPRDDVAYFRGSAEGVVRRLTGRVTAVRTFTHGAEPESVPAVAGDIATVVGLSDVEIGDQLGRWDPRVGGRQFAPPGLESVVRPLRPADRTALFAALQVLSEQDPLIDARLDGLDDEVTVSLYGEVQKEVLASRLADEFGIDAEFLPTATICVERVVGVGEDAASIGGRNAVVGLRVEAGPVGSGFGYRLAVERGWLVPAYHTAIEETLRAVIREGLHGWRVTDAQVTLIEAHYEAPTPPAGYFRQLTATTFRGALVRAGTVVCEPFSEFEVDIPLSALSPVLGWLVGARAVPDEPRLRPTRCRITGVLPTAEVYGVEQRLPGLTGGRGSFTSTPAGFRPVIVATPRRPTR